MEMTYDGALVMPSGCAMMDVDEMTYLEGGKYISKANCINGLVSLGMNPSTYIVAALTYTMAVLIIKKVCAVFGGIAGWVVGAVLGWGAAQVIAFGKGLARGALNKGVDVTWNWNPIKGDWGVNCSVRT